MENDENFISLFQESFKWLVGMPLLLPMDLTGLMWDSQVTQQSFLRKGKVGNWKEYLDSQQKAFFNREFEKRLGKSGLDFRTPSIGQGWHESTA